VTVYCCPHCRRTLTFRPGVRIEGLHEGDWSGCPGCGANMCVACGDAAGGHCPDCGAVVVANRMFARWLRPEGAWRDSLEYFDPVQLVAHATADVVDTLVATATARRPDFAGEVATLMAQYTLGGLAYVVYLRLGRESRLPLAWFANLERVARRLAVGAPDRWAATIDAMILIEGLARLAPERLALPWPADLLHHEEAAVRDAAAPLLDRAGASAWSPFDESPKSRAELEAALADRDQHFVAGEERIGFTGRDELAPAALVEFGADLLEMHAGELAVLVLEGFRHKIVEDGNAFVGGIFLFPRRGLHFLETRTHDDLHVVATEATRRTAAVHRGIAATEHDHALADLLDVTEVDR